MCGGPAASADTMYRCVVVKALTSMTVGIHGIRSSYGNVVQQAEAMTASWVIGTGYHSCRSCMMTRRSDGTESISYLQHKRKTTSLLSCPLTAASGMQPMNAVRQPMIGYSANDLSKTVRVRPMQQANEGISNAISSAHLSLKVLTTMMQPTMMQLQSLP